MSKPNTQIKNFANLDTTFEQVILDQIHLHEAQTIVINAFMTLNPVWVKSIKNVNQIQQKTKDSVQNAIKNKIAFGVILKPTNRLACVVIYVDLFDFKQMVLRGQKTLKQRAKTTQQQKLTNFQQITLVRHQLQKVMIQQDVKKGEIGYGLFLAINPQFYKYKLGYYAQAIGIRYMKKKGYKQIFGITNNPASVKINQALGGKIIATRTHKTQKFQYNLFYLPIEQDAKLMKYLQTYQHKSLNQLLKQQNKIQINKSKL